MSTPPEPTEQVLAALQHAARGIDLKIRAEPELRGASVTGTRVRAYVVPVRDGGYRVELWYVSIPRYEAYKVLPADDLTSATRIAIAKTNDRRRVTVHRPAADADQPRNR